MVARRDFLVTVSSKGFLFGVLVMPVIMVVLISVVSKLMSHAGARMNVEVALLDHSVGIAESLRRELDPGTLAAARAASTREVTERLGPAGDRAAATVAASQPSTPQFTLRILPAGATVGSEKDWLADERLDKQQRRALVVIPAGAVVRPDNGTFDTYAFYAPRNLPEDAEGILHVAVRQALVAERLRATGLDPDVVREATKVAPVRTVLVSADGTQQRGQGLNRALPLIMGVLMFMGVLMGGQALMTSTVEEKSSRVVEVLLAAVAPLELMWGKLIGQLGVSLVTMAVYVGLGLLALLQFAMMGLVDPLLVVYLFLFFLMSYLVYGALMQTIGAAVNQMADAQSLMGPVMILLVLPYLLTAFVGQRPDAPFAVIASFIPPVNAFVMMARLASSSPPPVWQVLLSLAASLVAAVVTVWFAAKVFRVGLLMHGKPPSFGTLVKWARMS
jgi:ABC-2 type transport system permease protein